MLTIVSLKRDPSYLFKYKQKEWEVFSIFKCIKEGKKAIKYYCLINFEYTGWDFSKERFYNAVEYKETKKIWKI